MVVGDFREDCGSVAHLLPCRDDKPWFLDEFYGLPSRMAGDSHVEPLICDCRSIGMPHRHQREFEEQHGSSIKHLNVH